MKLSPEPRFEYGHVMVPHEIRNAVLRGFTSRNSIMKALKLTHANADAIIEPFGVMSPEMLERVRGRLVELGMLTDTAAA